VLVGTGFVPRILFGNTTMKTALVLVTLIAVGLCVFLVAQGRSLRRAAVYSSVSELLSAEQYWQKHGTITNLNDGYAVYAYTA